MLQGDLDVVVNRAEFITFMQSRVPLGPGKFHRSGSSLIYMSSSASLVRSRLLTTPVEKKKTKRALFRSTPENINVYPAFLYFYAYANLANSNKNYGF